jgi:hypothetical protein
LKISEHQLKSIKIYEQLWNSIKNNSNQWKSMNIWTSLKICEINENKANQCKQMKIAENERKSVKINEHRWKSMKIYEHRLKYMKINGNHIKSMNIYEYPTSQNERIWN